MPPKKKDTEENLTRARESLVRSLLNEQRSDGSWGIYHGAAAGDINTHDAPT